MVTDLFSYGVWIKTQITMFVFEIVSQNQISDQGNLRNNLISFDIQRNIVYDIQRHRDIR